MHSREIPGVSNERSPLLQDESGHDDNRKRLELSTDNSSHPRAWSKWKKLANIAVVASMAPSSMFAPVIEKIADDLDATTREIIGFQTGFVIMLGIGPLVLAPLSETFGRKILYTTCFTIFTLLQIPTGLTLSLPVLIFLRTVAGFFGAVSVANGGGTISDMYEPNERAGIFGWYLLGPLLGPAIGPLLGEIILSELKWPTYVPAILAQRKKELEKTEGEGKYYFEGEDDRPLSIKPGQSVQRPIRILFTQPIILTIASYQALLFATAYSLYTQFSRIYGKMYGFNTLQVGLVYLGLGLGFLSAVWFLIPKIDTIYNALAKKHGKAKPEFRLPLANVGAILIPLTLFWFAWAVEYHAHWFVSVAAGYFYGIGQVAIFNCIQNYYINSFEKYAASTIAAGALFRSVIGGVVPLFTPMLLDKLGVGSSGSLDVLEELFAQMVSTLAALEIISNPETEHGQNG
ncbi:hypothetical protein G7Y89_g2595 [Cudoniella acicularis]|uniref:Major facilitator superfamily (MFS) profile domain-containing protein n=1 Tax=Cudoniella acicularis TaxID=354080 RepID=A0A8H4RT07_9HELO|nr:hypothetical protein G7Y89_g2595 [Cudoniella acicularis]